MSLTSRVLGIQVPEWYSHIWCRAFRIKQPSFDHCYHFFPNYAVRILCVVSLSVNRSVVAIWCLTWPWPDTRRQSGRDILGNSLELTLIVYVLIFISSVSDISENRSSMLSLAFRCIDKIFQGYGNISLILRYPDKCHIGYSLMGTFTWYSMLFTCIPL